MITQRTIDEFKASGTKFRNSLDNRNVNWGMYTIADINALLDYHVEYSPALRTEAKHIQRWLNHHGVELSREWYEEGIDGKVTRSAINNSNMGSYTVREHVETHYCERVMHWLNVALEFLQAHPTPIKSEGLMPR